MLLQNSHCVCVGPHRRLVTSTINLAALLALVVPVLRTLTESTADNTIAPLSGLCFITSIALADHSRDSSSQTTAHSTSSKTAQSSESTTFKATISLNAAVAGATILSSRLQSNLQAFVLLFLAIGHFGLFPLVKHAVSVSALVTSHLTEVCHLTEVWRIFTDPVRPPAQVVDTSAGPAAIRFDVQRHAGGRALCGQFAARALLPSPSSSTAGNRSKKVSFLFSFSVSSCGTCAN